MWKKQQQILPLPCTDSKANFENRLKKSVSFATNSTTYEIEYIPDEFANDVWYSEMEISAINSTNMDVAVEMSLGMISEGDQFTSRGLEHLGRENMKQRKQTIMKAVFAVLEEQKRQIRSNVNNPSLLAASYRANGANKCQKTALALALEDEIANIGSTIHNRKQRRRTLLNATNKKLRRFGFALIGKKSSKKRGH